jgi:hypothetical protein
MSNSTISSGFGDETTLLHVFVPVGFTFLKIWLVFFLNFFVSNSVKKGPIGLVG